MQSLLKWPDYLILASFLGISLVIGLYHSLTGGKQKTTAEFILADRRLQVLPTAISLLVSFHSAILVLGYAAEMYSYGPQLMILSSLCFVVNAIVVERIVIPWLYPLKMVSVNEVIHYSFFKPFRFLHIIVKFKVHFLKRRVSARLRHIAVANFFHYCCIL